MTESLDLVLLRNLSGGITEQEVTITKRERVVVLPNIFKTGRVCNGLDEFIQGTQDQINTFMRAVK